MIKIAFIDDHLIVRSGFIKLLSMEKDIQVVGEYDTADEASAALETNKAHIYILDISIPGKNGLELLAEISKKVDCIMLSIHESPTMVEKAFELGARGFLSKSCSPEEMINAVHTVANGKKYLTSVLSKKLATSAMFDSFKQLTKRERQVGELLAKGLEIKDIANELELSPKTVHIHRANAMDKLNVRNNVELARCFDIEWI